MLIEGIITEHGLVPKEQAGQFAVRSFLRGQVRSIGHCTGLLCVDFERSMVGAYEVCQPQAQPVSPGSSGPSTATAEEFPSLHTQGACC